MRLLLRILFSALGLLATSYFIPGIYHRGFVDLLVVAFILGILNATLGALLKLIAFIPVACSFGCFSLVINGLVFWFAGSLSQALGLSFHVSGFMPAFLGALVSSVVAAFLEFLFIPSSRKAEKPRNLKIIR